MQTVRASPLAPPSFLATDPLPCRTILLPLPSARLASAALRALSVDRELSPLVRREFSLDDQTVLRTEYAATTNRMLRVATNGFFESVSVALQVMQELDVDVLHEKGLEGLERVQGVEVGMAGSTVAGG